MFNKEELEFIVHNCMTADTIRDVTEDIGGDIYNHTFNYNGKVCVLDDYDCVACGNDEPVMVTPGYLLDIINEADPEHVKTSELVNITFKNLSRVSGFSSAEYVRKVIALTSYIKDSGSFSDISLTDCTIDVVVETIGVVSDVGVERILKSMSNSITPIELNLGDVTTVQLSIRRLATNDISITSTSGLGSLVVDENGVGYRYVTGSDNLINMYSSWDEDETVDPCLIAAMSVISTCVDIKAVLRTGINNQEIVNDRNYYTTFVYDKTNPDSMVALGVVIHHLVVGTYTLVDITDVTVYRLFVDKDVCFIGVVYDRYKMRDIIAGAKSVLVIKQDTRPSDLGSDVLQPNVRLYGDGNSSVPQKTWDYFINKPIPFIIQRFDTHNTDYLGVVLRLAILNLEGDVLSRVSDFVTEIMETTSRGTRKVTPKIVDMINFGRSFTDEYDNIVDARLREIPKYKD